jgi:hypothetical protein
MGNPATTFERYFRQRSKSAFYPLKLTFTYTASRDGRVIQRGMGETIEMSSCAVRAKFAEAIPAEVTDLRLSIAWPATLSDGTNLQFVVEGRPSWEGARMEVRFWRYEFRTAPRRPVPVDKSVATNDAFALAQAS